MSRPDPPRHPVGEALVLALGAAVSLGLARFSYALMLPPMRADLGWSYLTGGLMNTVNAAGYLAGALLLPMVLRRWGARAALLAGSLAASGLLAAHGLVRSDLALYGLRMATGAASAFVFVAGGVLAAGLATRAASVRGTLAAPSAGLLLGLYYGGTGIGIVASALVVPWWTDGGGAGANGGWPGAWWALGLIALLASLVMVWRVPPAEDTGPGAHSPPGDPFRWAPFATGLAGYFMFGLGYIGYMTFIVTLLREQAMSGSAITAFYVLLGLGVMASPWLWAGLLQRQRGGGALARLNALLAIATALPVLLVHPVAAFVSGALFGGVFLSVVASTTALVRHNLAPSQWPRGISAFTIVFAAGQIVGPGLSGLLADAAGGLRQGLAVSAVVLLLGAALAALQKPIEPHKAAAP